MARKKIKLEEAISEILVANTDSEPGSEASDFEDYFEEEEEEEEQQQQQRASAEVETQAATAYQPGDRLKEGTQIFIRQISKRCEKK
jgi:hypothetical protein